MGAGTADGTGIGLHWAEVQTQTGEDIAVGLMHPVIGLLQGFLVEMEGVGVLHQEFAAAHQAKARADLVAEFGLNLEEVDRQLLVAIKLVAGQIGDDFLVGWANTEFAVVSILEAQQLRAVLFPATGLLPKLSR